MESEMSWSDVGVVVEIAHARGTSLDPPPHGL